MVIVVIVVVVIDVWSQPRLIELVYVRIYSGIVLIDIKCKGIFSFLE